MFFSQEEFLLWLSQYAYQPYLIYGALVGMMLLSSVGFPIPEEVTLVSVGIIAYMGAHPDLYPPPYDGAPVVSPLNAAIVAFFAVVICDTFIFCMGKFFGSRILKWAPVQKFIPQDSMQKVEAWTKKYGAWACGLFRFTPGVRFPGHMACGSLGFPLWKFVVIDGIAAGISVPTQIFLIAVYGESILSKLKQVKLVIFGLLALLLIFLLFRWFFQKRAQVPR